MTDKRTAARLLKCDWCDRPWVKKVGAPIYSRACHDHLWHIHDGLVYAIRQEQRDSPRLSPSLVAAIRQFDSLILVS